MKRSLACRRVSIGLIFLFPLWLGSPPEEAAAQSGPGLLIAPLDAERPFALRAQSRLTWDGRTETASPNEIDIFTHKVSGRALLPESVAGEARQWKIGFSALQHELETDSPQLPERLSEQSIYAGGELGDWNGWSFELGAGFGFAGTTPYTDSDALFFMADLVATREIDEHTSWKLWLNFDGNRTIFPDLPLPGVQYQGQFDEDLFFILGLPYNGVIWRPTKQFVLDFRWYLLVNFDVQATYHLNEQWSVFASLDRERKGFMQNSAGPERRLFLEQWLGEVGVQYRLHDDVELTLAGGYAFEREFSTGWDVRDDRKLLTLSDEPFVRVAAKLRF